jgi:hypothetical protein
MFVFMMMIFSEKMRLFVQKKNIIAFLNDCIVSVSAGGRYQPFRGVAFDQ